MKNKVLFIVPFLLCSCSNNKINLYLGENLNIQDNSFFTLLENDYPLINHDFSSNQFIIKEFYNQLEKDALNLATTKSINSLLKNTDKIILNIGNYELLRFINYEYDFSYNKEVIKTSLEMFEYYLHQTLDILTDYTTNIKIIPLYKCLLINNNEYVSLINQYNEIIQDHCLTFNASYVNIEKLSSFVYENNYLSVNGYQYLIGQINND